MMRVIDDPDKWFANLGGLHDSSVESFEWTWRTRTLSIKVDDLFSNFHGTDQEVGSLPATINFIAVRSINILVNPVAENLWIYEAETQAEGDGIAVNLRLAPGGHVQISCNQVELSLETLLDEAMTQLLRF